MIGIWDLLLLNDMTIGSHFEILLFSFGNDMPQTGFSMHINDVLVILSSCLLLEGLG